MKRYAFALPLFFWASSALADPVQAVDDAARNLFTGMPDVQMVSEMSRHCGARPPANQSIVYCTRVNTIFVREGYRAEATAPFAFAHMFGRAAQVQHGVADFAFNQIQRRPDEELVLRSMVIRQTECLAGVFYARAGLPKTRLTELYTSEPFTEPHWGRGPIASGPSVSIGFGARDEWFLKGQSSGDPLECSVEEITSSMFQRGLR
ncbi:MAG: hypothetical protein AAF826_10765 [Pseudomonadota bacterium]